MSQPIVSMRTNLAVFTALLALLALTVGAAYLDLGNGNAPVALGIAVAKAALIVLFFMHLKHGHRLTWMFMGAGLLWLAILLALTLTDYLTRWSAIPGK